MHRVYGTLDAELEVQRTIKRAELTSFLCLLRKAIGPTVVHVDNKVIIDGLWRGEMKCIGAKAKDADLWILIWKEVHRVHQEGILVEVEHVKAHRSKKENSKCRSSKSSSQKGNDELAKEGAMLDGGGMAQIRATEVQQKREEIYAASQHASSSHCLVVGVTRQ